MRVAAFPLAFLIAIGACRTTEVTREDPVVPSDCLIRHLVVSPAHATLSQNDTIRVTARDEPCSGPVVYTDFRWSSSDTSIALVDSLAGLVRARKQGLATIIARAALDRRVMAAMAAQVVP